MTCSLLSPLLLHKLPNEANEYVACIQLMVMKSTLELKHIFFLGYNHAGVHVDYFQCTFSFFPFFFGTMKFGHLTRGGLILKLPYLSTLYLQPCLCLV